MSCKPDYKILTDVEQGKVGKAAKVNMPEETRKESCIKRYWLIFLASFVIAFSIALCVIIGLLYVKADKLEQQIHIRTQLPIQTKINGLNARDSPEEVGILSDVVQEGSRGHLPDDESQTEALAESEISDIIENALNETGGESTEELNQLENEGNEENEQTAIHLVGNSQYKSIRKSNEGGSYMIDIWNGSSAVDNSNFDVEDNMAVLVPRKGLYLIYAQLSWRMKRGMATFIIQRSDPEPGDAAVVNLAQCITNFSERYATVDSCYTSITTELDKGDQLTIAVPKENLTLDFTNGRSFFGAVLLREIQDD